MARHKTQTCLGKCEYVPVTACVYKAKELSSRYVLNNQQPWLVLDCTMCEIILYQIRSLSNLNVLHIEGYIYNLPKISHSYISTIVKLLQVFLLLNINHKALDNDFRSRQSYRSSINKINDAVTC
jgi:hypothetical protein